MGSGKTWAAKYLETQGYTRMSFAAKLKDIAFDLFGIEGKDGNARTVYQKIGIAMRDIDPDVWVNYLLRTLDKNKDKKIVIDDLRFNNEAEALRSRNFYLVQIYTSESVRIERLKNLYPNTPIEAFSHVSEKQWMEIRPDRIISGESWTTAQEINRILELPW